MTTQEFEQCRIHVGIALGNAHDAVCRAFEGLEGVSFTSPETDYVEKQCLIARQQLEKALERVGELDAIDLSTVPTPDGCFVT